LICILILTTGMLAIAALLGVTTQMHIGAREAARSTRLAQDKIDDLMKLNFASAAAVQVGGSLTANVANYFEQPMTAVTVRWVVATHAASTDLRQVTVRIVNLRSQQYGRQTDISTIIRQW
jgi:Tfp pilus assembly protein PilV